MTQGFGRRHLPHLRAFAAQPIVFITVVTRDRRAVLDSAVAHETLCDEWERARCEFQWTVGRYVLMPDHVHLFARGARNSTRMSSWIGAWKGASSRQLNQAFGTNGPFWQRDYFDRFLRSADDFSEKWDYVVNNPVRKGLASHTLDWRWQGVLCDLTF